MAHKTSTDQVRELYESSADSYDKMMDGEIDHPLYTDTLGRLSTRIADLPGPVIDTSCGSGHMLELFHTRYDADRELLGIELSTRMTQIATARLQPAAATVMTGDMRDLRHLETGAAAIVSFFALHHLTSEEVVPTLVQWHRVLVAGGQLVLATWEGEGLIDYGSESDVAALRFSREQLEDWTQQAGFAIDRCVVEPVEGMGMDAVYLEGSKPPQG
jgi:ubiquinone/menaquinone biosynthesis C-methylase UbiE